VEPASAAVASGRLNVGSSQNEKAEKKSEEENQTSTEQFVGRSLFTMKDCVCIEME
jgi:hypothetical protein